MDVFLLLGLCVILILGALKIFKSPTKISSLDAMKQTCKIRSKLNVFVDAGEDDPLYSLALDCVCRALDMSECPEHINIFIIVQVQAKSKKNVIETSLESTCEAFSNYSMFFEDSIHVFSLNAENYGKGGLSAMSYCLKQLESISESDTVIWMPHTIKLDKFWDRKILKDMNTLQDMQEKSFNHEKKNHLISYPLVSVTSLEQNLEELLFIRKQEDVSPCYYFVDHSLQLGSRQQSDKTLRKKEGTTLLSTKYISSTFPFVTFKHSFLDCETHFNSHEVDLVLSFKLRNVSMYLGNSLLGKTLRKHSFSQFLIQESLEKLKLDTENKEEFSTWLLERGVNAKNNVLYYGFMGVEINESLEEKCRKWGTEAKYMSFKEAYSP